MKISGAAFLLLAGCQVSEQTLPSIVDFNDHIRPVLSDRCFACHGPDDNAREADLKLHTEEGAFAALDGGEHFIIKPGDPRQSELYQRINSVEADYMMPPPSSNLSLTSYEIDLVRKWIQQGAPWERHWSFIPPERPDIPSSGRWAKTDIDQFVQRKMKANGLAPNPRADKAKLMRRVYLDLTGLPPDPVDLGNFMASDSESAFEEMVDAALASEAFGERMATDWLDIARYADSHGYQDDRQRSMWPWRNWIIKAFNDNLRYDQFVTWQLAGDLLENPTYEQKLATGFNRNHAITQEGGVINEEYLTEYAADRTDVFGTAFLGLTMQCARCHDHKYDPISQEDFYQLFAFFNNLKDERGQISYFDLAPSPSIPEENPQREKEITEIKATIAQLEDQIPNLPDPDAFSAWATNGQVLDLGQHVQADVHQLLDDTAGWTYAAEAKNLPLAKVNINLPPSIERPEKVTGKYGHGLKFNGENFLSLGDVGDFEHNQDFTIGAWIRRDSRLDRSAGLLARRNGELAREGYDLFIQPDGRFGFSLIGERRLGKIEVVTTTGTSAQHWYHVMATYDGSGKAAGVKIYVNGTLQPIRVIADTLQAHSILNGNDFLVGNWNHRARKIDDRWGFAGGTIDEPVIFNRQLSAAEIKYWANKNKYQNIRSREELEEFYVLNISPRYQEIKNRLSELRGLDLKIPNVMVMEERDTIKPTFVLERGAYDSPREEVMRGTPAAILSFSAHYPKNRLGLSQWLFSPENPLTARVYMNRLWQMLFGRGLVATPEDFGSQGKLPSHPQLLDYLADEFRASGWNIKHMLKLMVMSQTYQQDNSSSSKKRHIDPDNMWLSRGPHQTLTAEMLRDQVLKISGLLNPKVGGKWVKPYQPAGIWKALANQIGENKYRQSSGDDLYRRSIYTYWKRTIPPPTMLTLDAPERSVCTVKRQSTSTPLQALILLNDPTYVEAARVLAQDLLLKVSDEDQCISEAFWRFTARHPSGEELEKLVALYEELRQDFATGISDREKWLQAGQAKVAELPRDKLAAMTAVCCTIINLDEAKHK